MKRLCETHPVIQALRGVCARDLPRYEAMIVLMQEHFFKVQKHGLVKVNQASIDQFLMELHEEDEVCFDREETFEILAENTRDLGLLKAIFDPSPRNIKRGRS